MDDLIRITAEAMNSTLLDSIELVDITTALDDKGSPLIRYELYRCKEKDKTHYYMIVSSDSARTCIPASKDKLDEFFPDYSPQS